MQKSVFLYTNNVQSQKEIKKAISFASASKRIENLEINLTKGMKDEEDLNKLNSIQCS